MIFYVTVTYCMLTPHHTYCSVPVPVPVVVKLSSQISYFLIDKLMYIMTTVQVHKLLEYNSGVLYMTLLYFNVVLLLVVQ